MKVPLGLWEGSTESATLVSMLLVDLVDHGLDPSQGPFVTDLHVHRGDSESANTSPP